MKDHSRRIGSREVLSSHVAPPEGQTLENCSFNESEDRFQKLFLSTKEAILISDSTADQFLDVNLEACALLGYSRRELLNLPPARILAQKEDRCPWSRNQAQKRHYSTEFRHKSGVIIPCQISARPIKVDREPRVLVVVHRATEHQTADMVSKATTLARFLNAVAVGMAQTPTIEHSIRFCVRQICDFLLVPLGHARLFAERIISSGAPTDIWHIGLSARSGALTDPRRTNPPERWLHSEDWYSRVLNAGYPFTCEELTAEPDFPGKHMARQLGLKSALVVPILFQNEVTGALEFFSYEPMRLERLRLEIIAALGGRIGYIVEHKRAERNIQDLSTKLFRLQDDERRHLAKELHDTTAQNLAAIVMDLGVLEHNVRVLDSEARGALLECVSLARQSLHEVRTFSYLLHPPMLDELGLVSALRIYVEGFSQRSGMRVDFVAPDYLKLPADFEVTLFHVVQEGLANAHRHSGSAWAKVNITANADEVRISVENETTAAITQKTGVGLLSMQERVQHLGGRLVFHSDEYRTLLEGVMPLPRSGKARTPELTGEVERP